MPGSLWLRFLSGPDIARLGLTGVEIIAAVEDAVRAHGEGRAIVEPRVHLVPGPGGHFNVLRGHLAAAPALPPHASFEGKATVVQEAVEADDAGATSEPGLAATGVSGIKVVGDFVDNYQRGLPSELGLLTLLDPSTGIPLAIMDATFITACRTGAMTAVGAKYLARPDARILGHVGARGTALWNVLLLNLVLDLAEIRVTSRRPESREAFGRQLEAAIATPVRVVDTAEEAFDGADVLVEASRLTAPEVLLHTSAVRPGAFVVPYGTISAVELDLLDVMDKVVVDDWREAQAGQFGALRRHVSSGRLSADTLYAELGQIVAGAKPGRESSTERILLWHRGLAILDIAVGELILRKAEQEDVGTMLRYR